MDSGANRRPRNVFVPRPARGTVLVAGELDPWTREFEADLDLARAASRPGLGQRATLLTFARTLATICHPRGAKPEVSSTPQGWEDYLQKDVHADEHGPRRSNTEPS
jgi:hypothetical protein